MASFDEIKQLQFRFGFEKEELEAFDKVIKLLYRIADEVERRNCGDIHYDEFGLNYTLTKEDIREAADILETVRNLSGDFLDID